MIFLGFPMIFLCFPRNMSPTTRRPLVAPTTRVLHVRSCPPRGWSGAGVGAASNGLQWGEMGENKLGDLLVFSFLLLYFLGFMGFILFQNG